VSVLLAGFETAIMLKELRPLVRCGDVAETSRLQRWTRQATRARPLTASTCPRYVWLSQLRSHHL